ncbi:hypothetical protein [Leifsonia sp. NPDC080035]|uniref:DNA-binding protein n=1 Tax=Leifsonia sp. NPDC080035 TaxID=3143936 RepID=A0AAU7GE28_9MICO
MAEATVETVSVNEASKLTGYSPQRLKNPEVRAFLIEQGATFATKKGEQSVIPRTAVDALVDKFGAARTRSSSKAAASVAGSDGELAQFKADIAAQEKKVAKAQQRLDDAKERLAEENKTLTNLNREFKSLKRKKEQTLEKQIAEHKAAIEALLAEKEIASED